VTTIEGFRSLLETCIDDRRSTNKDGGGINKKARHYNENVHRHEK